MAESELSSRCGFVALVGAPNAGKSTLLNALVGAKVSIVSAKKQTTRRRILGIVGRGSSQILFVDTPGIFTPRRRLDRAMVAAAWAGVADADFTLLLVDAAQKAMDRETAGIVGQLREQKRPALVALNKIDLIPRGQLLGLAEQLNRELPFAETFMISALTGDGLDRLLDRLAALLPPSPWLYPEDQLSDLPLRAIAAEITREKLYLQLHQELPYAATVETEAWEEQADGSVRLSQVVFVQRDSQKAIVLGKGGSRIKALGIAARTDLEQFLERRVHLVLFVKVREAWGDDPERYREIGLDFPD
ncbi:MAG: GTPase Era [Azospirillum sp.]|nr:GTPase Era [Azospirillum sp.]